MTFCNQTIDHNEILVTGIGRLCKKPYYCKILLNILNISFNILKGLLSSFYMSKSWKILFWPNQKFLTCSCAPQFRSGIEYSYWPLRVVAVNPWQFSIKGCRSNGLRPTKTELVIDKSILLEVHLSSTWELSTTCEWWDPVLPFCATSMHKDHI